MMKGHLKRGDLHQPVDRDFIDSYFFGKYLLTETIRRGFKRVVHQQNEVNRIMIHLATANGVSSRR